MFTTGTHLAVAGTASAFDRTNKNRYRRIYVCMYMQVHVYVYMDTGCIVGSLLVSHGPKVN